MITVIGIGTKADELTDKAKKAILAADAVFVRTNKSKAGAGAKALLEKKGIGYESFDALYESAEDFCELNARIAKELTEKSAAYEKPVYLVDGDGFSDESVIALFAICDVTVLAGTADSGGRRPSAALLTITATELTESRPYLDTAVPLFVTGIDNQILAGAVKLYLMRFYADDQPVIISVKGEEKTIALFALDYEKKYDYSASCYLAADGATNKKRYNFGDLMRILARLTAPDGCPWDKVQTHDSIRLNMIEEAYEAVDAITNGNTDEIAEEIGDVLLQAAFHCDIGERTGGITLGEVITGLCTKLVTRHTHIFGADRAADPGEALKYWEKAKAVEKSYSSVSDQLSRLPENFPATLRAEKALKKLKKAGVAFGESETFENLQRAAEKVFGTGEGAGALLFWAVALCSQKGADAEVELLSAVKKLIEDFAQKESAAKAD